MSDISFDVHPVVLEGVHAMLRPLQESDADALSRVAFDPDLWKDTASRIATLQDLEEYIRSALGAQRSADALPFVTIHKPTLTVVGSTRFANIDRQHRRVEIGWTWIARPWQRTAVNTEAKYLMLRHAFEVWRCQRVELKTAIFNHRSRRAIERIGGREEGIFRKHMILPDGRIRDTVYYSIVDDEWDLVRKKLENMMNLESRL